MSIFAPIVTRDSQRQSEPEPEPVRPSPPPKVPREQPSTAQTHIPKGAPLYNCVGRDDKGRKEREPPKYRPAEKVLEQLDKEQKKQQKNQRKHKHISTLTKSIQNVLETIN